MTLIDHVRTRCKSLPPPLRCAVGRSARLLPLRLRLRHGATFSGAAPGIARVKAVPADGQSAGAVRASVEELGRKTGGTMVFELQIVDDLPAGARGTRPWFRQGLDIAACRDRTAAVAQ